MKVVRAEHKGKKLAKTLNTRVMACLLKLFERIFRREEKKILISKVIDLKPYRHQS